MKYVKHFTINGIDTTQVGCIELNGRPNAATAGAVGLLGIDVTSATHDVYKCVAVNGSLYTWELLSSGMSVLSANITGEGAQTKTFPYSDLRIPNNYLIKVGDLIIDRGGYLYQISALGNESCDTAYTTVHLAGGNQAEVDTLKETINVMINYCKGVRKRATKQGLFMNPLDPCIITITDESTTGTVTDARLESHFGFESAPTVYVNGNTILVEGEISQANVKCSATVSYILSPNLIGE